jgi:antitoxin component YwqK of YwqJK toxin-antitoxin module
LKYDGDVLISEKTYKLNIVVNVSKTYYNNGNIKTIENYTDKGKKDGYFFKYDIDGTLMALGYYSNGFEVIHINGTSPDTLPDQDLLNVYISNIYKAKNK